MAKTKISDDPEIARKQMARQLASNSIVTKALARYIEKVLEAVNEDTIQPLRDENDRLRAALQEVKGETEGYAERLAIALWEKHWKNDAPEWKPLSGDLLGILTQIDNMTAGLVRPASPEQGREK